MYTPLVEKVVNISKPCPASLILQNNCAHAHSHFGRPFRRCTGAFLVSCRLSPHVLLKHVLPTGASAAWRLWLAPLTDRLTSARLSGGI